MAKEYRIKRKLEKEGWTVFRTAGSHGLFDLIAVEQRKMDSAVDYRCSDSLRSKKAKPFPIIKLIQCKSGKSRAREVKKVLQTDIKRFEGLYVVSVEVI